MSGASLRWRGAAATAISNSNSLNAGQRKLLFHTDRSAPSPAPATGSAAVPSPPAALEFKRDPRFAALTKSDVDTFQSIVGSQGLITEQSEIEPYNRDWMKKWSM